MAAALAPQPVYAAPTLLLPTPPGQTWKIIQGYGCGTHNSWDRYSLDLANTDGSTYDAPVRAAANGEIWHWESGSGTLILNHGGNFFTMYTHMARAVSTQQGRQLVAGETLGFAGDRGAPGTPHLHFTAFTANRDGWSGKQSVPLQFAEGYNLPDIGGCNQHGGTRLEAMPLQAPEIHFSSEAQPDTWYRDDQRVEFSANWAGGGLSQAWNKEPAADEPMFGGASDGYAQLLDAGEGKHTLYVRVWGPDGQQTLASYGPIGLDSSAPTAPGSFGTQQVLVDAPATVQWPAASDRFSGVAGYRVYIGDKPNGEDDWFSDKPTVKTEPLAEGAYFVRVQALDQVGNAGEWVTVGKLLVAAAPAEQQDASDEEPEPEPDASEEPEPEEAQPEQPASE